MRELRFPASEAEIRALKVGDELAVSGVIVTARDAAHKFMVEHSRDETPVADALKDGAIYHCGPVTIQEGGEWKFLAAGPTTSIREEPYQAAVMEKFGVRGVIGKGGMGPKTVEACRRLGGVYLHAIGGAASSLAQCVKRVLAVHKYEEFGPPEAFWVIEVEKFPVVVTIDSRGESLHQKILEMSKQNLESLLSKP